MIEEYYIVYLDLDGKQFKTLEEAISYRKRFLALGYTVSDIFKHVVTRINPDDLLLF